MIKSIDKAGGLDNYLLGGKAARVRELGMGGWRLRAIIMRTDMVKERFQREREALGLLVGSEGVGQGEGEGEGVEAVGTNETEEIDEDVEEEGDENEDEDDEFEGEDEELEDEDKGDDRKLEPPREKGL